METLQPNNTASALWAGCHAMSVRLPCGVILAAVPCPWTPEGSSFNTDKIYHHSTGSLGTEVSQTGCSREYASCGCVCAMVAGLCTPRVLVRQAWPATCRRLIRRWKCGCRCGFALMWRMPFWIRKGQYRVRPAIGAECTWVGSQQTV